MSNERRSDLAHHQVFRAVKHSPQRAALTHDDSTLSSARLAEQVRRSADRLISLGPQRGERVGVYLEKRVGMVPAAFGALAADGAFAPINPLLNAERVGYISSNCNICGLVTSPERFVTLETTAA